MATLLTPNRIMRIAWQKNAPSTPGTGQFRSLRTLWSSRMMVLAKVQRSYYWHNMPILVSCCLLVKSYMLVIDSGLVYFAAIGFEGIQEMLNAFLVGLALEVPPDLCHDSALAVLRRG